MNYLALQLQMTQVKFVNDSTWMRLIEMEGSQKVSINRHKLKDFRD